MVGEAGEQVNAFMLKLSHPPEGISGNSGSDDASFGVLSDVGLCASASLASGGRELGEALAEAGVPSAGDERGHDLCAAAAAEASISVDDLAAPAKRGNALLTIGTLFGVAAAAFADLKAGARDAGSIVPSEPLVNWLRESSKDKPRTACAGELVTGSNWMAGRIGTAIKKARSEFDLGVSLARLLVGAGLAGAVGSPFVVDPQISVAADAV